MTRHAAIDIETFDTNSSSLVLSIGLAIYNPDHLTMENYATAVDTHQYKLDLVTQLVRGRTVSRSTLDWWGKQSDAAKAGLYAKEPVTVPEAINDIAEVLARHKVRNVWANGPDFDIVIVNSLADTFKIPQPIHYRTGRCLRTLRTLFGHLLPPEFAGFEVGDSHNALDDAVYQAVNHAYIHRALKNQNALDVYEPLEVQPL